MKIKVNEARQPLAYRLKTRPIMSAVEATRRAMVRYAQDFQYLKDR